MKDHVAIIIHRDKDILFIQRSAQKSKLPLAWAFPTGTREEDEELFETVVREGKEELDVELIPEKVISTKELPEFNDKLHFIICSIKSGEPKIMQAHEIENTKWLTFKQFFEKFNDDQIGHGLIYLRENQELLGDYI